SVQRGAALFKKPVGGWFGRQQDFEAAAQLGVFCAGGIEERLALNRIAELPSGVKKCLFLLSGVIHHRDGHTSSSYICATRRQKPTLKPARPLQFQSSCLTALNNHALA